MMKRKKILICCILAALLTIVTIIPIFADLSNEEKYSVVPADLGELLGFAVQEINPDLFYKFYLYITFEELYADGQIRIYYTDNDDIEQTSVVLNVSSTRVSGISYYTDTINILIPTFDINSVVEGVYIPIYVTGCTKINVRYVRTFYSTINTTQESLRQEAYEIGYDSGYNNGFNEGLYEGQNIQQYTNLVGYVEQLIGQFTGSAAAQYITPIAIVLVVLFVYFLFIRFLLSLVKAKGIIKTCDIIMIVACIIMLVVMYAPMLDLTIKTEQINSSEETTEAAEVVRSSNIYKITTETGDIYYGPVGTAIVTKSDTIEDIYKISEDIETEAIAYEKD